MFDNIHLRLERFAVGEEVFSSIASRLSNCKEVIDRETGEARSYGSLGGLKVTVYESSLYIVGSLAKFYNGSNIYTLNRKDTERAVQKLSEALGADISTAKVSYLEFGDAFLMENPVEEYLKRLGSLPRLHRNPQQGSLYYQYQGEQRKSLVFYDKKLEMKKRKDPLPDGFQNYNILRFELRFKNRLPKQIGWYETVTASTLYDRQFYKRMQSLYRENYFAISKRKMMKPTALKEVCNPKDAFSCLTGLLLSRADTETVADFMSQLAMANVLDRQQLYRFRQMVERAKAKGKHLEEDTLIMELDNQIINACLYC
ncbi:MAG: hypothetical protein Q4C37_02220 [Bacteroidales bacterium]|nr:hypothetical protein [Bacteroidales bacterium]